MISEDFEKTRSILESTEGIGNPFQLFETFTWIVAVKFFFEIDQELRALADVSGDDYESIFSEILSPNKWVVGKDALTGDALIKFLREIYLPGIQETKSSQHLAIVAKEFFRHIRLYPQSGYKLKDALDTIFAIDLISGESRASFIGAYEFAVVRYAMALEKPFRYFTPRPLVNFVVSMVGPNASDKIYDPAFGTSGFLLTSFRAQIAKAGNNQNQIKDLVQSAICGKEKDPLQYAIGLLLLFLNGVNLPRLQKTNTLNMDVRQIEDKDRYDVIYCNPTFDSAEDSEVRANFPFPAGTPDLLFVQHIERSIKYDGKIVLIMPEGFMFKTNEVSKNIKAHLLNGLNLRAVISLPQLGVKASVLYFERNNPTSDIWMYDLGKHLGRTLTVVNNYTESDFYEALHLFRERALSQNSCLVSIEDIRKNDFNLSVSNYLANTDIAEALETPEFYLDQIEDLLAKATEQVALLKQEI